MSHTGAVSAGPVRGGAVHDGRAKREPCSLTSCR